MNSYEQHQEDRLKALEEKYERILEILEPIADTYKAASKFGKWFMGFMVFISILLGVILSIRSIIK